MKKFLKKYIKCSEKDNFINIIIRKIFGELEDECPILYPDINIVSLGCNCMPRTILTRYHVKPRKTQGELSCPFDLVIHPTKRVTYYLKNDFEGYFDDLDCKAYKRNLLDFRGRAVWYKPDGTKFNHDKDCGINDREKLVKRINSRIINLKSILASDKPILFVQSLVTNEDVENLYKVLKKIRKDKEFKLLIYDFNHQVKKEIENVTVLDIPYPSEDYHKHWNKSKYYDSEVGKSFEGKIVEVTKSVLEQMRTKK